MEATRLIPGACHPRASLLQGSYYQPGSTIGARTKVYQFASIVRKARIGEDCSIGPYALIDGCWIGDKVAIGPHAFVCPGVEIMDEVFFGPGARTCNDSWPMTDKTGFDMDALLSDGSTIVIHIGPGASVGAGAIILPGTIIGAGAMIAAGAVVKGDVPVGKLYKRSGEIVDIDPRKIVRMKTI